MYGRDTGGEKRAKGPRRLPVALRKRGNALPDVRAGIAGESLASKETAFFRLILRVRQNLLSLPASGRAQQRLDQIRSHGAPADFPRSKKLQARRGSSAGGAGRGKPHRAGGAVQ